MRPLDKIEKYLKRFTSNIVESEHSRYFKLNGCTIRVSDHFATTSVCYISIIISINEGYVITNPKTAKVAIVKYDELKGIIKSLSIIPDVVNNTEIEGNQALNSKIKNLETQVNSYKSVITTLKEKVNQFNLLSINYNKLKTKHENLQKEKQCLIDKNKKLESKIIDSKYVYGLRECSIPLSIRTQIKALIAPYK